MKGHKSMSGNYEDEYDEWDDYYDYYDDEPIAWYVWTTIGKADNGQLYFEQTVIYQYSHDERDISSQTEWISINELDEDYRKGVLRLGIPLKAGESIDVVDDDLLEDDDDVA
jgi:hypothetical protein